MKLSPAQRTMLGCIADFGDGSGWSEVELQFLQRREPPIPRYLEAVTCERVIRALQRKGLVDADGDGPRLTERALRLHAEPTS